MGRPTPEEIADWLERTGLSLSEAGELLDVDRSTLWRWSKGQAEPAHPRMLSWAMRGIEEDLSSSA